MINGTDELTKRGSCACKDTSKLRLNDIQTSNDKLYKFVLELWYGDYHELNLRVGSRDKRSQRSSKTKPELVRETEGLSGVRERIFAHTRAYVCTHVHVHTHTHTRTHTHTHTHTS